MLDNRLYKIGLTQGDINGIGYEIIMKALADPKMMEICTPIIYGLAKVASYHRKTIDLPDFVMQFIKSYDQVNQKKCNLINLMDKEVKIELGKETEVGGELAQLSLDAACKDIKDKKNDALVTAPVNFSVFPSAKNTKYYAHIDYLSQYFETKNSLQMIVSDRLKVGIVASHLTISKVADVLTPDLLMKKITLMHEALNRDFGIMNPNIAVLAMNPQGEMYNKVIEEDQNIINPTINKAFDSNINVFGAFSAPEFFGSGKYAQFDGILALYDDQALIPFQMLSEDGGACYTAGLPIVHTAPTQGVQYDIAGKNMASPTSMRNAIYLAIDILNKRCLNI